MRTEREIRRLRDNMRTAKKRQPCGKPNCQDCFIANRVENALSWILGDVVPEMEEVAEYYAKVAG